MMHGDTETPSEDRPSFAQIVERRSKKDDTIRTLRAKAAIRPIVRRAWQRRDWPSQQFSKLRDQLIRQMDSLSADDQKEAKVIQDYVETRLSQL